MDRKSSKHARSCPCDNQDLTMIRHIEMYINRCKELYEELGDENVISRLLGNIRHVSFL